MKNIEKQKQKYIFLISILVIGIITGIIFIYFISNKDKLVIEEELELVINNLNNNNNINYKETFKNSISSNLLTVISTYILSISIIGFPIIIFILFLKGFIFGFTISSLVSTFNIKGLLLSLSYLLPSSSIFLITIILLSFHAISFSIKLFRYLFLKENIPLNKYFKNLNKIAIICLISIIICSLIETFISPILIDLCY